MDCGMSRLVLHTALTQRIIKQENLKMPGNYIDFREMSGISLKIR